jgi:pectate lyase
VADAGPHKCPTRRGGRWNSEYDNISVMNAERVWIDHNTFSDEPRFDSQFPPVFAAPFNEVTQKVQHHDGNVDVTLLATKVTISNNYYFRHDKTNLLGGSDFANLATPGTANRVPGYGPGKIDVTFHGNYYQNIIQRAPRVRFGKVHAYNNVFDVDRRTSAEYRLGDPWATGTAGKLYTENNLFHIINPSMSNQTTPDFRIPRLIQYASTLANRDICVAEGYALEDCGTYYHDIGTWVTVTSINNAGTVLGTSIPVEPWDNFPLLLAIQTGNPANAPLFRLDASYWVPNQSYDYAAQPVSTADERAALKASVIDGAGAGKL